MKIETYNKSLNKLLVLFYQKNLKETPPPITYAGVWTREDDIMDRITQYCDRNCAMFNDIVDYLDSGAIHRDDQKFDVFRIFEIMYPVLECITGPYGDPIPS